MTHPGALYSEASDRDCVSIHTINKYVRSSTAHDEATWPANFECSLYILFKAFNEMASKKYVHLIGLHKQAFRGRSVGLLRPVTDHVTFGYYLFHQTFVYSLKGVAYIILVS